QRLFEAGLESSRRALELIPGFLGAQVNCAAALMGLERYAEAEAPLRRAVELAPDKPEAHRDLGEILAKLDRLDEAATSYRRAVVGQRTPHSAGALVFAPGAARLRPPGSGRDGRARWRFPARAAHCQGRGRKDSTRLSLRGLSAASGGVSNRWSVRAPRSP